MTKLANTELGSARLGSAPDRMERAVAEHIEHHDNRKVLARGMTVEELSMPLPIVAEGKRIRFRAFRAS